MIERAARPLAGPAPGEHRETRQLIELARAGDVRAFAALASEHLQALERLLPAPDGGRLPGAMTSCRRRSCGPSSRSRAWAAPYRFGPWLMGDRRQSGAEGLAGRSPATPLPRNRSPPSFPHIAWDGVRTPSRRPLPGADQRGSRRRAGFWRSAISALPRSRSRVGRPALPGRPQLRRGRPPRPGRPREHRQGAPLSSPAPASGGSWPPTASAPQQARALATDPPTPRKEQHQPWPRSIRSPGAICGSRCASTRWWRRPCATSPCHGPGTSPKGP